MDGAELRAARTRAGWTQSRLGAELGVTQAYVSLLENSNRRVPQRLAHELTRVLDLPPTALPVSTEPGANEEPTNEALVDGLARLEYPGFAYLRKGRADRNPAQLLVDALAAERVDARVMEALPWLLLHFEKLDVEFLVRAAKLKDLQNRLGFVVALARGVADRAQPFNHRLSELSALERRLEDSRLAREDTLGHDTSDRMRAWLRDHRSESAKHWNLLTDLHAEHLSYAG